MKCIKCGHVVEPAAPRTMETELRGERVSVTLEAPQCPNCGRVVMLGKDTRTYYRAVSDAYRSKVGLLTTSELDNLRRGLNMKWPDFARYVFVGIATLKRWRRGEIQTQALDRLVRLRADPEYLLETASELREHLAAAKSSVEPARHGLQRDALTAGGAAAAAGAAMSSAAAGASFGSEIGSTGTVSRKRA